MHTAALIVAAGRGQRMGHATPKPFLEIGGRPVLEHCLERLLESGVVNEVVVAVPADQDVEALARAWHALPGPVTVVAGGARRQDSVAAALAAVSSAADMVLVHDGARPLVSPELVRSVVRAAVVTGAATAAIPCTDTIKEVQDGRVVRTLDRARLVLTQTPQAFRADWLRAAHQQAGPQDGSVTDDAGLVERLGRPVAVVSGDPDNLKVTYPADLEAAARRLGRENT